MHRSRLLVVVLGLLAATAFGCRTDVTDPAQSSGGEVGVTNASGFAKPELHTYEVTIENLTSGQPLSPPVAATHRKSIRMFQVDRLASSELEAIAEDGNQMPMVDLLSASDQVTNVVDIGMPLTPSGTTVGNFTDSATFEIQARRGDRLSLATMLICTNDGFTGLNAVKLPGGGDDDDDEGDRVKVYWLAGYDAGTEDNTELSEDIVNPCSGLGPIALPGDPDGNENDSVDTQPRDDIEHHPGIEGDGELSEESHDWDDPVAKVTVRLLSGGGADRDDDDDGEDGDDGDEDDDDDDDDDDEDDDDSDDSGVKNTRSVRSARDRAAR